MTARFIDRTIVVTGAGAGIGRATAHQLVAEAARVVAVDLSPESLDSLAREAGASIVPVVADLTDQDGIDAIVAAGGGSVDGLAAVAGITDGWLPPHEMTDEIWHRVLDLNVTANMRLSRALLPAMMERGRGTFAFVSSEASLRANLSGAAYTTSKLALNGFARSIAFYYRNHGIRSNVVAPGGVSTTMDTSVHSEFARTATAPILQTAAPRVDADTVARSILWLLSDDSDHVNGVVLPCDAGWTTY